MKPPPIGVRRALIDPLWPLLAAVLAGLFLVVAVLGALAVPLTRRLRPSRLALFAVLYLALDAGLVICCAALWLRHPRANRDQRQWSDAHQALLRRTLSVLVAAAGPLIGFEVQLQEPPQSGEISGHPLLVVARHGGPGDSFALVWLLMTRYQRRPAIVLKETLRFDPGLDVLLGRLPACFVRPGEGVGVPARLAELARTMQPDDAILLFPEGGNWTPGRHHRAIARLRRAGRRQAAADAASNPNVLPPHPAGFLACLAGRPDLDVAVVAHTGLEDLTSPALMWQALPVTGRPMVVRWWYEPAASIPEDAPDQLEWLRLQWAIVDSWIDARKAARAAAAALPATPEATPPVSPPAVLPVPDQLAETPAEL